MADFRIPPRPPPGQLPTPVAPARTEATRAAFFQAARGQAPAPTVSETPKPAAAAPSTDRPLRPGSLLDIKV